MWYGRRAMSQPAARSANLLGTVGLAVSDRIRTAGEDELGLGGSAPIAIVALSTYLADRPLDEIADAFGITASAVVRLVDRLEEEGLADRRPGPDRRRVSVRLTAKGDRRAKAILARREQELAGVLGVLSAAEQRELTRLHEKLLARVARRRARRPARVPLLRRARLRPLRRPLPGHPRHRRARPAGLAAADPRHGDQGIRSHGELAGAAADLAEGVTAVLEVDLACDMGVRRRPPGCRRVAGMSLVTARQL